jgi:YaaC-like protein
LHHAASAAKSEVFDLLLIAIRGNGLAASTNFDLLPLMRQVVTGHRLYLGATGKATENFLSPKDMEILHDPTAHNIWLRMAIASGDLPRVGVGIKKLLNATSLAPNWRAVAVPQSGPEATNLVWIEMTAPARYQQGYLADKIMPVVNQVRHHIWQTVLSVPPYRANYLFLPPVAEAPFVLPQIISSYAIFFYFGSITRYRPHHFDRILDGKYGAFTESFLNDQPSQLLFLFASEFARRETAKAAIV